MKAHGALGGRFAHLLLCVAAIVAVACGNENSKSSAEKSTGKALKSTGAAPTTIGEVKGSATGQALEAKADWGFGTGKGSPPKTKSLTPEPTPTPVPTAGPPGALDPSTISRDGIPEPITGFASVSHTGFRVAYARSRNPLHEKFRAAFQKQKVFESIANALNKSIKLPRVIDIHMVNCGQVNAFYDPNNSRIIMCYEIMEYFLNLFRPVSKTSDQLGIAVVGATFFTFFHELGHSLRHVLKLPVTGREEDAVDQLSTLTLLEGGDDGINAAMAGARWFALQDQHSKKTGKKMPFWDEHSLNGQRFYNVACLVYGSNPRKFQSMVTNGYLPRPRARRCVSEYTNAKSAWETLLEPHMHSGAKTPKPKPKPTPAAPAPEVPKPTPQPRPTAAISCEQVAQKVASLFVALARSKLPPNAPAARREQLDQELAASLPMLRSNVIQACNKGWTKKQRACIMTSKTWARADGCDKVK